MVWNSMASARRQPSLANRNAGCSLNTFLFRCTQISARMSFGQICSTYRERERGRERDRERERERVRERVRERESERE